MLKFSVRLECNDCKLEFTEEDWPDVGESRPGSLILWEAEQLGWKVYRTCYDHYYGYAWCPDCKTDWTTHDGSDGKRG